MIFFLIVIAIMAVVIPIAIAQSKQTSQTWSDAASQLGLSFEPGGMFQRRYISGLYHGFQVNVDTYTRSSGKHSKTYTRFRISYPTPLGLGLQLTSEGFFSGVTKMFGAQDIQVGDQSFDAAILVKGADARAVRNFLTPARRVRIQRFLTNYADANIDDTGIQCSTRGVVRDAKRLVGVVQTFVRLAWYVTGDRDEDEQMQRAMTLQNEGEPEKALHVLQQSLQHRTSEPVVVAEIVPHQDDEDVYRPAPVEERLLEGELEYLAGHREEAREAFRQAHEDSPEDAEIDEWFNAASEPSSSEPPGEEPVEPQQDTDQIADAKTVCDDVFQQGSTSYEANRQFEERYAGRSVRWSGILERAERNYSSYVFGESGGCKAVVKIHEQQSPLYGKHDVFAVVHFPENQLDPLKDHIGHPITFTGRLLKADGFMRNIYVGGGGMLE